MLSDDRKEVVGIVDKGEAINYRDVEDIMLRVLKSFPGDMEIIVIDGVVRFRLRGHGSQYVDLNYISPLYNFLKNKITHKTLSHV